MPQFSALPCAVTLPLKGQLSLSPKSWVLPWRAESASNTVKDSTDDINLSITAKPPLSGKSVKDITLPGTEMASGAYDAKL